MNPIANAIAQSVSGWRIPSETRIPGETLIVGVCGTQASGKSTACAQLASHFTALGLTVGVLSLDDLYLGRAARAEMACDVHPLFATRGPPGTHDVGLGIATLDAVKRGDQVMLPRFDKRADVPVPRQDWPVLDGRCDLLLFEGWCVGAKPVPAALLAEPVNDLERAEDTDGRWRHYWNAHLAQETAALFARIDRLVYLRPPSFETVFGWRCEQEHRYIESDDPTGAAAAMTDDQVARFISHYERLTRWIMDEMPTRADLVIQLGAAREVVSATMKEHMH
jgi:D-glycerate 3-kinase